MVGSIPILEQSGPSSSWEALIDPTFHLALSLERSSADLYTMRAFVREHLAVLAFWTVFVIAVAATLALLATPAVYWPLTLGSIFLTLLALYIDERVGFVRKRTYRRSGEPPRHFSGEQTLLLYGLVIVQAVLLGMLLYTEALTA